MTMALAMGWLVWSPFHTLSGLNVDSVIEFLNRNGHNRYRYLTLGFGNALPKVSTYANPNSVDGEYNSARLLAEMTHYGSAQLTSSKFFGTAGMESLRAVLKHANNYGLKYIFVHDPFYEPMLAFAAAGLYGKQLLNAGCHRDLRAMCRLPLLPRLAVTFSRIA